MSVLVFSFERFGTHAFAIYRIVLGAVILISLRTG